MAAERLLRMREVCGLSLGASRQFRTGHRIKIDAVVACGHEFRLPAIVRAGSGGAPGRRGPVRRRPHSHGGVPGIADLVQQAVQMRGGVASAGNAAQAAGADLPQRIRGGGLHRLGPRYRLRATHLEHRRIEQRQTSNVRLPTHAQHTAFAEMHARK